MCLPFIAMKWFVKSFLIDNHDCENVMASEACDLPVMSPFSELVD